ncbi:MAG: nickel-dependent hydrogenase large subunit [Rhodocyclaceae bacterium]|nr:nickel-dependent hydrogenase large subunit [Rhodocyclaceae bacterium]
MSGHSATPRRLVVGPFNRVEGDLEVELGVADGRVTEARVNASLYRGFEQMLMGRDPLDALVYVPRICGICSVSQSVAAAFALADAAGIAPPPNGRHAFNLIHGCENLADHLTHFYLFFMPDFARDAYAGRPWHATVAGRFKAVTGQAAGQVLPARARFLEIMGLMAGHWPHSLALQPGGTTRGLLPAEPLRLGFMISEFRAFLERTTFGDRLEAFSSLASLEQLAAWRRRPAAGASDLGIFLDIADDLDLIRLGRATDRFLSYGAYPGQAGDHLFARGVTDCERVEAVDPGAIKEDATHAWLVEGEGPLPPFSGVTAPMPDKEGAYTWCKAPRYAGRVVETGALARQMVAGHPLVRELVARHGGSVLARVLARLLEIALVLPAMEDWARALRPGEAWCEPVRLPDQADGIGLTEAARGSLGHWLRIHQGRLQNYQIVAPTTWNFSPRDRNGQPGALEQALVGAPVGEHEKTPLAVQHVVRSFDPCMVCTVH